MLSLLLLIAASADKPAKKQDVAGWTVRTDLEDDACSISVELKSGAAFAFDWRPRRRSGSLYYTSPAFKSIERKKQYEIEIGFQKGKTLDQGWGKINGTGYKGKGGHGFRLNMRGNDILSDLASSSKIGFWYRNELIGTVPLAGSSSAVEAIRRCSAAVLNNHPRDPFEQ